jgi:hypothetical protein
MITAKPCHELATDCFASLRDPERETRRLIARLQASLYRHHRPSRLTAGPPQALPRHRRSGSATACQLVTIPDQTLPGLLIAFRTSHPERPVSGLSWEEAPTLIGP